MKKKQIDQCLRSIKLIADERWDGHQVLQGSRNILSPESLHQNGNHEPAPSQLPDIVQGAVVGGHRVFHEDFITRLEHRFIALEKGKINFGNSERLRDHN